MATNEIKFRVKNGLAVGASGFVVINDSGEWVGASGAGQSPYGATGPQGAQGAQGTDGVDGSTGVDGATGSIGLQGVDGDPGHQGATGLLGSTGADGASGFQGIDGSDGYQGATGSEGTQGASGSDGFQGIDGATGIDGASGAAGIDGASGPQGEIGATGPHGYRYHATSTTTLNLTTGSTGVVLIEDDLNYSVGQTILISDGAGKHIHATVDSYNTTTHILAFTPIDHVGSGSASSWEINLDGAEGKAGASGATGYDGATGLLGDQGYQGASGADGVQGVDGQQGYQGASGADGYQGATGLLGSTGADGASGFQGIDGADGYQGATGSEGTQGDVGDQGFTGPDGATGYTGATGAQGTDGSSGGATVYRAGNWNNLWWVGANISGYAGAMLSFNSTDTIYGYFAALNIGDSITIDFSASGLFPTPIATLTVTEAISTEGSYNSHKILVSGSPNSDPDAQYVGNTNGDSVTFPGTGPTNTGFTGPDGATGATGPEGNQGYTGEDGATGYTGATGVDGASGPTGVDGATGIIGIDAATGPTGADGATGITGIDAATGFTGQDGATGVTGATGIDGASGPTGQTGDYGATGSHGLRFRTTTSSNINCATASGNILVTLNSDGYIGYDFSYSAGQDIVIAIDHLNYLIARVVSYDGIGGLTVTVLENHGTAVGNAYVNLNGAVGWIGASGATGLEGATGYEGATGATGPGGDQGITGDQGVTGDQGTYGASGATGPVGDQGTTGDQGATGIDGSIGTTGDVGVDGATGATGTFGATGAGLYIGATSFSGTSANQVIDMFASNVVGTAKYLIQGYDGAEAQATELIITQDGNDVFLTEYGTVKTDYTIMNSVTATLAGSVVSVKLTPVVSNTSYKFTRRDLISRIGGITYEDDGSNTFSSRTHTDTFQIPAGKAYIYLTGTYWPSLIDFAVLAANNDSITVDAAGIGPQNPATGTVDSWDGYTLIVTIVSGTFTNRNDLDKITIDYAVPPLTIEGDLMSQSGTQDLSSGSGTLDLNA